MTFRKSPCQSPDIEHEDTGQPITPDPISEAAFVVFQFATDETDRPAIPVKIQPATTPGSALRVTLSIIAIIAIEVYKKNKKIDARVTAGLKLL